MDYNCRQAGRDADRDGIGCTDYTCLTQAGNFVRAETDLNL